METAKMVYVVKNALTKGIEYIEVLESSVPELVVENVKYARYFHKGDWFDTKSEAIKKADEMKTKRIQSLDKQLKKLKNLKFD